jgi:hypothetical protein
LRESKKNRSRFFWSSLLGSLVLIKSFLGDESSDFWRNLNLDLNERVFNFLQKWFVSLNSSIEILNPPECEQSEMFSILK